MTIGPAAAKPLQLPHRQLPDGIATQTPRLRPRLSVPRAAEQLTRYLGAITELMVVLARACGTRCPTSPRAT